MAGGKHITVVAWDLGHNAVGRPYFFTDMFRRRYESILLAPIFPAFGKGIWEPIRTSDVPMRSFPGTSLPEYVDHVERAVQGLETDLVIVSKPRFPALLIAIVLKRLQGVPVIADLDEWELSWSGANDGLSLDEVESRRGARNVEPPYGPVWTRAAEELIGDADAVTVASPVLQELYGGTIVPQARDERVFDPALYDRDAVRAEFGYTPEDRVVLFLGTPRRFKGILELAQALEDLGDPRYKLCVIGSIADPADRIELARVAAARTQLVEYQPVSEVPRLTLIGDLVCLLQDPSHRTTEHQLPAKLTEVLAMGVPVLAREMPPLEPLVRDGVLSGIGDAPVATRISELFADPEAMRMQAQNGREFFLEQLSYGSALNAFERVFAELGEPRRHLPANWGRAFEVAKSVPQRPEPAPAPAAGTGRAAATTLPPANTSTDPALPKPAIVGYERVQGQVEQVEDGVVSGWAWNPATPEWRVGVRAVVDGLDVAGAIANLDHPSPVGDGHHGFRVKLPPRVASGGKHRLRVESGGARLPAAESFKTSAEQSSAWAGVDFSLEDAIVGRIENVRHGVVSGWAWKPEDPSWRTTVRVFVDGAEAGSARAELDRPELVNAGLGDGRYGFAVPLAPQLASGPGEHRGSVEADGVPISASPRFRTLSGGTDSPWSGERFHVRGAVIGHVEQVSDGIVAGWAYRSGAPRWRVWVRVIVDGVEACSGLADGERPELAEALGDARHGFRFQLPPGRTAAGYHRVLIEAEGVALEA